MLRSEGTSTQMLLALSQDNGGDRGAPFAGLGAPVVTRNFQPPADGDGNGNSNDYLHHQPAQSPFSLHAMNI
jgi:hypothetical protein